MLLRVPAAIALALSILSGCNSAAAGIPHNCAECPPTIVYRSLTRTVTPTQISMNSVECMYTEPPTGISGIIPYCVYRNIDGVLTLTNTGPATNPLQMPGACPTAAAVVQKTTC